MRHNVNRRTVLEAGLAGAAGLALGGVARAADSGRPAATAPQVTPLSDHLLLVTGAGGNVLVLAGPEGAALVGGGAPEHARWLLKLVSQHSGSSAVPMLINTHWHLNHTGANDLLGKRGARILAHENTRLWMGTDFFVEWENRTYEPRPRHALPNDTFYDAGEVSVAGERVRYIHAPQAHTDGDIYVFLPDSNVLVTGDLLHVGQYPVIDYSTHGWIVGYLEATQALLKLTDAETRVIPGTGPVQTRAALEAQLEMCSAVKGRLHESFKKGNSLEEFIASQPTREFDAQWGRDSRQFLTMAYESAMGRLYQMGGGIV